jgi:hypothetical protein
MPADRRKKSASDAVVAPEMASPPSVAAEAAVTVPKRRERRDSERRESPRLPIKVMVKNTQSQQFVSMEGDISVGGMSFTDTLPFEGKTIAMKFRLPGRDTDVQVQGAVVQVRQQTGGKYSVHVRFDGLDIETELAIARFIDDYLLKVAKKA